MNLGGGLFNVELLTSTHQALEAFLGDPKKLELAESLLASGEADEKQALCLRCFVKTFKCYQMGDPDALLLRAQCTQVRWNGPGNQTSDRKFPRSDKFTHRYCPLLACSKLENSLNGARNKTFKLGFTPPGEASRGRLPLRPVSNPALHA